MVAFRQRLAERRVHGRLVLELLVDRRHRGLEDRAVDQREGRVGRVHATPMVRERLDLPGPLGLG